MYLAMPDEWLEVIAAQDNGFNSIMAFGHNSRITEFANYLSHRLTRNVPSRHRLRQHR